MNGKWFLILVTALGFSLLLGGCSPSQSTVAVPTLAPTAVPTPAPTAVPTTTQTPAEVTESFYTWYIEYARNTGNPLVDKAYHESEFVSDAYAAKVDETLAGFDKGGYDPFLQAQDIPVDFVIEEPVESGDSATVVVQRYWGGNPDPSLMTVHLQKVDGRWQINGVAAEMTANTAQAPAQVVQAFYDWYLSYIGEPGSDTFRNPMVDKAYHDSPFLTAGFVQHIDELLAGWKEEYGGFVYDPILCAQDIPTEIVTEGTFVSDQTAAVVVGSSFPNHVLTVDLRMADGRWQISNITCSMTPEGSAKAFYTWYLAAIGDRASGEMHNPLVEGTYRDSNLLTDAFIQKVEEMLASFDRGGYDPILLAQDIPQAFSVDPGLTENTVVVHEMFGATSVQHLQVTMVQEGSRWLIDDITEATAPQSAAPTGDTADWHTFVNDEYGFSFQFPAGWVVEKLDVAGPGMPDDWPVVQVFQLMPPDVTEQQLERGGGPPDPTAPVIVAPFTVEVLVGGQDAFNRRYVPASASQEATFNGNRVIVEKEDPEYTVVRYVFQHPDNCEVWVVVLDVVSEFPGREDQAQAVADVVTPMLNGFTFSQ